MRNRHIIEQPKKCKCPYGANTCMIGINYLYSFSYDLKNIID